MARTHKTSIDLCRRASASHGFGRPRSYELQSSDRGDGKIEFESSESPKYSDLNQTRSAGSANVLLRREGSVLVSADYSQVELRILAHIADDKGLQQAFESDQDIHTATASEVFGVKFKDVERDQRRAAKAINFGIAYGMSDFGLAESLGVERKVADGFLSGRYFKKFPGRAKLHA